MKSFTKFLATAVLLTAFFAVKPAQVNAQGSVSFQVFYDDLSPYGQWVSYSSYGYVWVPSAGPDFTPYSSGGHWVWTDYGWTWASDYSWGWAPFHYGRWDYDTYYGWVWIPDTEWGPAWVSWRRSEGYYGWAPMGPGISIDIAIGGYNPPADHWVFVQDHYMGRSDIHSYYGPRKNNQTYINNSTVINNTYVDNSTHNTYVSGPRREEVQKVTGRDVQPVAIKEDSKPGQRLNKNELNIYRPRVAKSDAAKPAKIAAKEEVKPIAQRPTNANRASKAENAARTPAANKATAPKANQQAQPRKQPIQGKQPINQNRKQNSETPKPQQKAQPQQKQQAQPQKQQPAPQPKQQPTRRTEPQRQQPVPQQQPKQQPAPQQRRQQQHPRQQAPAPQQQPRQQQAPAPRPQPVPAPAPQPRPQPGNRPH